MKKVLAFGLVGVIAAVTVAGCKKGDDSGAADPTAGGAGAAATAKPNPVPQPIKTAVPTATATANNDADANAIKACCSALRSSSAAQKTPADKAKYDSAATTCEGLVDGVRRGTSNRGAALGSIRAAMRGGTLPSQCN